MTTEPSRAAASSGQVGLLTVIPEWCRRPVAPSRSSQGGREGERRTHEQRAGVRVTAVVRAVWDPGTTGTEPNAITTHTI